ncbi:MAG: UvrD-helicase domain-containing protein, partial [Actinomycetes bacterium]
MTTTAPPASTAGNAAPAAASEPAQLGLFDPAEIVACLPAGVGAHRIIGAPGTGKTSLLVELAARRVAAGLDPDELLVLAASRRRADDLRERLSRRLRRTMREPAARTMHSLAFGLLRRDALLTGAPAPRLVSAPEQDRMLRELLEGHRAGEGGAVVWPAECADALPTRTFRTQLRDLFARATERGLEPEDLRELGLRHDEPAWVAAGGLWREYLDVLELREPGARDPAGLIAAAVAVLETGEVALPWRLVLVDDYHEADPDHERLLLLLARHADVVVAGDPDVTVQTFRGADVQRLAEFPDVFRRPGGRAAETTVLTTSWRRGTSLLSAAERVGRLLPGSGTHRRVLRPAAGEVDPAAELHSAGKVAAAGEVSREHVSGAEVHVLASPAREATFLATRLRQEHLHRGTPWSRLAVLTRTRGRAEELRRLLASAGVPVRGTAGDLPLAQERAVAALVTAMQVCLQPELLDTAALGALLAGPLVGVDPVQLRRLLPRLPAAQDASWWAGGDRRDRAPEVRLRRILAAGRRAARADDLSAESLLWAVWEASGVAGRWQERALRGGMDGARADRDLDAVMALFALAARAADGGAGVAELLETVSSAQVRADTLRATGVASEQVDVLTVHEAAGREWDVVALAGMQEGVWPDLRVRGTLLGADRLVDVLAGRPALAPRDAVAALRREELRLLYL